MHPSYVTRQLADDIALINLDQDVEWNDFVQPACLPNPDKESFAGLLATASGWGWTDEVKNGKTLHQTGIFFFTWLRIELIWLRSILGGKRANTLQKVDVPIIGNRECQQWYKDEKKSLVIVETAMCAGLEKGGKDSCQVIQNSAMTMLKKRWSYYKLKIIRAIAVDRWSSGKTDVIKLLASSAPESVAPVRVCRDSTRASITIWIGFRTRYATKLSH